MYMYRWKTLTRGGGGVLHSDIEERGLDLEKNTVPIRFFNFFPFTLFYPKLINMCETSLLQVKDRSLSEEINLSPKRQTENIDVCKTLMPPLPNLLRIGLTFNLQLSPTEMNINRDHLLMKDYLPTKFEACGAKRSWVISAQVLGD